MKTGNGKDMAAQKAKPIAKTLRKSHRKINERRVVTLAKDGCSAGLIAKDQSVATSTITRYLQSIGLNINELSQYKTHRADLKAILQAKAESKLVQVVESIGDEDISAMDARDKKDTMIGLTAVVDRSYQQERAERGIGAGENALAVIVNIACQPIGKVGATIDVTAKRIESGGSEGQDNAPHDVSVRNDSDR